MNRDNVTASSIRAMQDIKFNHVRGLAGKFLAETNVLDLHISLTEFLIKIDDAHQKEIHELGAIIEAMALATNK